MFAEKLKFLRKKNNLTQEECAKALKVTKGAIAMWETDKRTPDLDMLKFIANYFKVSLDWLTGNNEYENINDSDNNSELNNVYFSLAKEAQSEGIDPDDIRLAFELIKARKKKNRSE